MIIPDNDDQLDFEIRRKRQLAETYEPTQEDIKWARMMMSMIKNGAVLCYPDTKAIYSVNHKEKKLTLRNPEEILNGTDDYIHYRTKLVFNEIGYECVP